MKDNFTHRPRILFISRAFPPVIGGIEKQNAEIHRHLSEMADVTLVANRRGKRFLPLFLPYAIIYTLWRARRHDVVLLGDGVLAIGAWALSWMRPRPLVFCILHGLDLTFSKPLYQRWWVRRFLPKVDVLLPVSRQTAIEAVNRGLSEDRCQVIPNGVNPEDFTEEYDPKHLQRLLGCNAGDHHIVLTAGRLVERKGVHWFVENVLPKLDEEIIYVIAGDGPMRRTIKKIVVQQGLDSRVFLLGRVSDADLRTLYAAADIFVQPNIPVEGDMEGFGLVVLEAGASGLPVIASRIEGLTDAISEGNNGQLLTPGRADEYVAHIHALINDTASRYAKGQRAKAYVRQHFPWKAIADRYLKTFNKFLRKYPGQETHESEPNRP
ncbi:MAG: glycosyltransferase family 4 protein [Pseudomonadota bacterium]